MIGIRRDNDRKVRAAIFPDSQAPSTVHVDFSTIVPLRRKCTMILKMSNMKKMCLRINKRTKGGINFLRSFSSWVLFYFLLSTYVFSVNQYLEPTKIENNTLAKKRQPFPKNCSIISALITLRLCMWCHRGGTAQFSCSWREDRGAEARGMGDSLCWLILKWSLLPGVHL